MKYRTQIIVSFLCIAALALASQQVTIPFKPKQGSKLTFHMAAELDINGQVAKVNSDVQTEVLVSDEKTVEILNKWENLKVEIEGTEMQIAASDQTVTFDPVTLTPKKVKGGLEGSDPAQFFLAGAFAPPVKEIKIGDKYSVEVAEVKDEMPAYRFDGEYVVKEDLAGKPTHKFKGALKIKGEGAMTSDMTAWVREDGTLAKVEATFKAMDIPIANAKGDGKVTLTRKD